MSIKANTNTVESAGKLIPNNPAGADSQSGRVLADITCSRSAGTLGSRSSEATEGELEKMTIRIPPFLHDVLGKSQTVGEVLAIVFFGVGLTTLLFFGFPEMTRGLPLWRSSIAYVLVVDIFAGCVANFTYSTSNYYAAHNKKRLVFIAVHVHILIVAWLLGVDFLPAVIIWGYTIAGALVVNALKGSQLQLFVAGVLLATGISVTVLGMESPNYFLVISLLFMMKVMFSFTVDHYGKAKEG